MIHAPGQPDSPAMAPSPRCAVIGAGAMGLSLAAVLGQRVPVTVVVRDPVRAAAIGEGITVRGSFTAQSTPAALSVVGSIAELADSGPFEAVFVATKTTAIDQVADELHPILPALAGPDGAPYVVSFQNGIEPGRRLVERLAHGRVVRMVLNYGARLDGDASAEILYHRPPNFIGGPDARHCRFCQSLAALLTESGLETVAVDDIEPLVWTKGIVNAAMNPVAALVDGTVGEVLDSPAREIVARLLHEGVCVAQAEGTTLGRDPVARMWAVLDTARSHLPSMVEDIRAGRESEVGQLNRQIIAHGDRVDVDTPSHRMITALIESFDWRVFRRESIGGASATQRAARVHRAAATP